jgi:hypothetical protein
MVTHVTLEKQIEILFAQLNRARAGGSIPEVGALSTELTSLVNSSRAMALSVKPSVSSLFATAAVEMWQRGLHSFLISAALSNASPIWASISGYYASHYTMRGFAHLLGFYRLHHRRAAVRLEISGGAHVCNISRKGVGREHQFYWKVVKNDPHFANDPFFGPNSEDIAVSDSAHRNVASYSDHIAKFPRFDPLDEETLKRRITSLAEIELSSVPTPNSDNYPEVENVQLIAYHRIVKFRNFVDGVLGGRNSFWNIHREPDWSRGYIDFQVTAPKFISSYSYT